MSICAGAITPVAGRRWRRDWYAALARQLPWPRWQGEALAGRALLIGLEAGLGDMIQFFAATPPS